MTVYAETSAVLAWLFGEPAGNRVKEALDAAARVVSSALTPVEAGRTVERAESQALISSADAAKLRGLIARNTSQWTLLEIGPTVRLRAGQAFPVEPVRTLDALHLASALEFLVLFPDLKVLSLDDRVLANLPQLGLATEGP